jgi:RNA polymerase-binding transcription factor DksA
MSSAGSRLQHGSERPSIPEEHMHSSLIRDRLQQRRKELQTRTEHIDSDLRGEAIPAEDGFADQAAAHANDPVLQAIQKSAGTELEQIDIALRRIEAGRYEHCARCGVPIGKERLEALPYATTCTACAS